jgi:hypothetical protein
MCFLSFVPSEGFSGQVKYMSDCTFIWNGMEITVPKNMTAVMSNDESLTIYTKYNNKYLALDFGKYINDYKHVNCINNIKLNKDYILEESRDFNFKGYPSYNITFLIPRKDEKGFVVHYEYGYRLYIEKKLISIIYLDDKNGFSLFKPIIDNISFVCKNPKK